MYQVPDISNLLRVQTRSTPILIELIRIKTFFLAVDCGPLSVPMNGSSYGDLTVFPNSINFTCDPGFILNGSTIRTCQPDGTWTGRKTICVGKFHAKVCFLLSHYSKALQDRHIRDDLLSEIVKTGR